MPDVPKVLINDCCAAEGRLRQLLQIGFWLSYPTVWIGAPFIRLANVRDCRRKSRHLRLLKNTQLATLRAIDDPTVTGLSDETQAAHL
ncbi:hypothetical protein [Pseudomonas sp. NFX224]|uniref:hypothetical protein n=1 Tax=Pseudomonas sp. NFX224 TaxID=3402862 RepID=UPI003AFA8649